MRRALLRHPIPRRVLTISALAALVPVTVALAVPVILVDAVLMLRPRGRGRAARITIFLLVYLSAEILGLADACWLWLRSGFGTRREAQYQQAHYALLAKLLSRLYKVGSALFALRIETPKPLTAGGSGTTALPETPGRPLIVLSRHAGPGDSFLLVHALLNLTHRRPRIVLKETLAFDPLIDVAIGRLPHCFVGPGEANGRAAIATIAELARTLGPADALLVFPEGGKFTLTRRRRAIASLRRQGLLRASARAKRLRHVLPPQPAGVFTALDAAPHADLVFVAHTGLDHMQSVRQVWESLPLTHPIEVTWWTVPSENVPRAEEARLRWLDGNWSRIDGWVGSAQAGDSDRGESTPVGPSPET